MLVPKLLILGIRQDTGTELSVVKVVKMRCLEAVIYSIYLLAMSCYILKVNICLSWCNILFLFFKIQQNSVDIINAVPFEVKLILKMNPITSIFIAKRASAERLSAKPNAV